MQEDFQSHEALVEELKDPILREEYARAFDHYKVGVIPAVLGFMLVAFGTIVYGKRPSYGKFKAIEIIARIPYQSWEAAAYTLVSAFHGDEKHAIRLAKTSAFSRGAQDNETMHVVVISQLARRAGRCGLFRHSLIPLIFAFFYFWAIFILYLFSHRAALELNYVFESHAYKQYQEFLDTNHDMLSKKVVNSDFLDFYGRKAISEYELFETIRNDELIHRNRSIRELDPTLAIV